MSVEDERGLTRDAMHRRVEDSLAYRLTMLKLNPDLGDLLQHELPLFVAVGALSDDEATAWRERFTLTAEAFRALDSEVVDEGQRARARELVHEVLADYEASKPDSDRLPFWRFPAVLRALKAVGAVSEDEATEWDRRFHELLERKSKPKREARQRAGQAQREFPRDAKRYEAAELSRVVVGPPQRLNGVRVTCAELYEDCVVVRWYRILSAEEISRGEEACADQPTPEELAAHFGAVLSLEDDLGTGYEAGSQAHRITGDTGLPENDNRAPVWGRSVFTPAVPERANRLAALNGDDEFALALKQRL
jgi:hypothetical protein